MCAHHKPFPYRFGGDIMGNQSPDEVSACASSRRRSRPKRTRSRRSRPAARAYENTLYFPPGKHPDRGTLCTGPLWVARRRAKQEGFELIEGSCFWAEPSAPTLQASYESMRDEILGAAARRNAGRRRAARPARRDGRARLRRLRGRPDRARARDRRAEGRSSAPSYDPHCHLTEKRVRGADISHPVQGIPAHRFRRARRGTGHAGGQGDPPRHQAGHLALRLRHDRRVPDLARAGPRLRREDEEARRPRRRAVGLARPRLHAGRRARAGHARAGRHRQRQGARRCAGARARRGDPREARHLVSAVSAPTTTRSRPPMRSRRGRSSSPIRPTMRAAARPRTTPTSSAACWSAAWRMPRSARCGIRSRSQFCHAVGVGATLPLRFGGKTAADIRRCRSMPK